MNQTLTESKTETTDEQGSGAPLDLTFSEQEETDTTPTTESVTDDEKADELPVDGPEQALERDAKAEFERLMSLGKELEDVCRQLQIDANLNLTGESSGTVDMALDSGSVGKIAREAHETYIWVTTQRLQTEADIKTADSTTEGYLKANQRLLRMLEDFPTFLARMSIHTRSEAMGKVFEETRTTWMKHYTDALLRVIALEGRQKEMETLKKQHPIVEGLIKALESATSTN